MSEERDLLFAEYTIDTPENVIFDYQIAGIGSRFIAAITDHLLLGLILGAITLGFITIAALLNISILDPFGDFTVTWIGGLLLALYFLLDFIILWGYFIFFELAWNGQTPGKKTVGIRVIQTNGGPAKKMSIVVRNLLRIVDWLPWAYFVGLVTMLLNEKSCRLGDFAAGTIVIKVRSGDSDLYSHASGVSVSIQRKIKSLSPDEITALYEKYPHIDRLTGEEYELAEKVTFSYLSATLDSSLRPRLAKVLSPKVGGPLPDPPGSNIEATRILKEMVLLYNIHHHQKEFE